MPKGPGPQGMAVSVMLMCYFGLKFKIGAGNDDARVGTKE